MTREQMIDEAVRCSMKRVSLKKILFYVQFWERARTAGEAWYGHPSWLEDDKPFFLMPRRLAAIRTEFRRLNSYESC